MCYGTCLTTLCPRCNDSGTSYTFLACAHSSLPISKSTPKPSWPSNDCATIYTRVQNTHCTFCIALLNGKSIQSTLNFSPEINLVLTKNWHCALQLQVTPLLEKVEGLKVQLEVLSAETEIEELEREIKSLHSIIKHTLVSSSRRYVSISHITNSMKMYNKAELEDFEDDTADWWKPMYGKLEENFLTLRDDGEFKLKNIVKRLKYFIECIERKMKYMEEQALREKVWNGRKVDNNVEGWCR